MPRQVSRADTALHRNTHDPSHAIARNGRLAWHLSMAAWRPLRALNALIVEVERTGCGVNSVVMLQARRARDAAWPYLTDDTGEIWK